MSRPGPIAPPIRPAFQDLRSGQVNLQDIPEAQRQLIGDFRGTMPEGFLTKISDATGRTVSGAYMVQEDDFVILCDVSGGPCVLTFPAPITVRFIYVVNLGGEDTVSLGTLDGIITPATLEGAGAGLLMVGDGVETWRAITPASLDGDVVGPFLANLVKRINAANTRNVTDPTDALVETDFFLTLNGSLNAVDFTFPAASTMPGKVAGVITTDTTNPVTVNGLVGGPLTPAYLDYFVAWSDGVAWWPLANGNWYKNVTNIPTDDEKAALQGTFGAPSNTNRYVTDSDPRLASTSSGYPPQLGFLKW